MKLLWATFLSLWDWSKMLQVGCPVSLSKDYSLGKPHQRSSFPTLCTCFDTERTMRLWGASHPLAPLLTSGDPSVALLLLQRQPLLASFENPRTFQSSLERSSPSLDIVRLSASDHHNLSFTCINQPHLLSSPHDPKSWPLVTLSKPAGSQWDHSRAHHFISMACLSASVFLPHPVVQIWSCLPSSPARGPLFLIPGLSLTSKPESQASYGSSVPPVFCQGMSAQGPGLQGTCTRWLSVGSYWVANRAWPARCAIWLCLGFPYQPGR